MSGTNLWVKNTYGFAGYVDPPPPTATKRRKRRSDGVDGIDDCLLFNPATCYSSSLTELITFLHTGGGGNGETT